MEARGWRCLGSDERGTRQDGLDRGWNSWTSVGTRGWKLARSIASELRDIRSRLNLSLGPVWTEVIVVTDHGWLLLPDGLPKVELKAFLAETRWSRCAALKANAQTDSLAFKGMDPDVMRLVRRAQDASGVDGYSTAASRSRRWTPVIRVTASMSSRDSARILEAKWTGARVSVSRRTAGRCSRGRTRCSIRREHFLLDRQAIS